MAAARKKKPDTGSAAVQQSVRVFTTWTPALLRSAEQQADSGNLRAAANLCDWLLGDDRVRGTLDTRVQTLLGLEPSFEPSGDKRRSNRAVKALEAGEDWWEAFPESELAALMTWGILLGVSYGQHRWRENEDHGNRVLPYPEHWHAQHLRFDWPTRRWLTKIEGGADIEVIAGDGTWILHTPYGPQRPWAMGLWRGLAPWVLLKAYARQDWARFGEKAATLAVTSAAEQEDDGSGKDQRNSLANDIYARGRDAVVVLPPGFDMKLVTTSANSESLYRAQIDMANMAIAIAIRGGNLTTEVSQGGSRAATESQERTGDLAKLKFDAQALTTTVHDQSLEPWADYNYGDRRLAPWPVYPVEPEEDLTKKADTAAKAAEAATQLQGLGLEIEPQGFIDEFKLAGWAKIPEGMKPGETLKAKEPEPEPLTQPEPTKPPPGDGTPGEPDDGPEDEPPEARSALTQTRALDTDSVDYDSARTRNDALIDQLKDAERIVIAGGPRTGKGTLAVRAGERFSRTVRHADSLVGKLEWSEASEEVADWIDQDGSWIVEGVVAPRALRKWLKANDGEPMDMSVVWLRDPVQEQTNEQRAMAKGCETVWNEIVDDLRGRGANVIERDS